MTIIRSVGFAIIANCTAAIRSFREKRFVDVAEIR
jgi:hypothetical protein